MSGDLHPSASEDVAGAFFVALQGRDAEGIGALVTDDFSLEVPLHESGDNNPEPQRTWRGRAVVVANYKRAFAVLATVRMHDLVLFSTSDPNVVFGEAFGDMETTSGRPYKNRYAFRFDLEGGKIRRLREYCNPVTSAIAFDRPLPPTMTDRPPRL